MRTIRISEEVWNAIAERGRFGETPEDVLRRVFEIEGRRSGNGRRRNFSKRRMTAKVAEEALFVGFQNGPSREWNLPARQDKMRIREVRDSAVEFAKMNGATLGQENAVKKALTDAGYHLTK